MYIDMLYLQNDINILNNCTISMRKLRKPFTWPQVSPTLKHIGRTLFVPQQLLSRNTGGSRIDLE